jgi:hypothetical protein
MKTTFLLLGFTFVGATAFELLRGDWIASFAGALGAVGFFFYSALMR